jgi:uncharacterized protein (UPF0332 family)
VNQEASVIWRRAEESLTSARKAVDQGSPDHAANMSYHAAHHAVVALFAQEGRIVWKPEAVESALHSELVRTHRVPLHVGEDYSFLRQLRLRRDDVPRLPVDTSLALAALGCASRVVEELKKLLSVTPG